MRLTSSQQGEKDKKAEKWMGGRKGVVANELVTRRRKTRKQKEGREGGREIWC
jgi:hypothetical protein